MNTDSGAPRPGVLAWVRPVSVVVLTTLVSTLVLSGHAEAATATGDESGASSTWILAPVFILSATALCAVVLSRRRRRRADRHGLPPAEDIDVVHLDDVTDAAA